MRKKGIVKRVRFHGSGVIIVVKPVVIGRKPQESPELNGKL